MTAVTATAQTLARWVPADIGLFVEVERQPDLLQALTEPNVWSALAELAGQPAGPDDVAEWRERIRQTVGMEPEAAIETLFSQRVAFVGEIFGRTQDGVVLCELPANVEPRELLERWRAQPEAGSPVYALAGNIGVVVRDRVLIFGDRALRDGLLARMVRFDPKRDETLAESDTFRSVRRGSGRADSVLYIREPAFRGEPGAASQPAQRRWWLARMHREENRLHFSILRGPGTASAPRSEANSGLVRRLPASTLLAVAGEFDAQHWLESVRNMPGRNALRVAVDPPADAEALGQLVRCMRSQAALAVGCVEPAGRSLNAPPAPAIGLVIPVRNAAQAEDALGRLAASWGSLLNVVSIARGLQPVPGPEEVPLGSRRAHVLDLSNLIEDVDGGALGELHLAWICVDDRLFVATHFDWLKALVEADQGRSADLGALVRVAGRSVREAESMIIAQAGAVSDLGARWMEYLQGVAPALLSGESWRRRAAAGNTRLGIDVTPVADQRALRVTGVKPAGPADGLVRVEDRILGCNGARFSTTQPVQEMQAAIAKRNRPDRVTVLLERDGALRSVNVPLPHADPVQLLRRVVAVGRLVRQIVYVDRAGESELVVELRSSDASQLGRAKTNVSPIGSAGEPAP